MIFVSFTTGTTYSQLLPCGHPFITDTRYYGQNPSYTFVEVWLKVTPAIMDSLYCGIMDTFVVPTLTILLFWLWIKWTSRTFHVTYLCINCSLSVVRPCVNLYKHTSKGFRNKFISALISWYMYMTLLFHFAYAFYFQSLIINYLRTLLFSHRAIVDSKLYPEGVRYI